METYIGTFGVHDSLSDHYQPIKANTVNEATQLMEKRHGIKFCFIHTTDEFIKERKAGRYSNTSPLPWLWEEAI